ncbi:MAG: cell division protein FtsQ/DivIB [Candidatus Xenobiia bacterium LiM19]
MRRPLEKVQKGRRSHATPVAKKIFLLTIFVIAQVIFINSDFFKLRSIEINGIDRVTHKEILDAASLPWGANIMYLNVDVFTAKIKKMLWIKQVTLNKTYPGGVHIDVKERVPVVKVAGKKQPERWFSVDDEGVVLAEVPRDDGKGLPHLVVDEPVQVGSLIERSKVDNITKFYTWLSSDMNKKISDFMIGEDYLISFHYFLTDHMIEVKLGKLEDMNTKIEVFQKILTQMEGKSRELEYIDLRYKEPVVKMKQAKNATPDDEEKKKENGA